MIVSLSISVALGVIVGLIEYYGYSWAFGFMMPEIFAVTLAGFLSLIAGFFVFEKVFEIQMSRSL